MSNPGPASTVSTPYVGGGSPQLIGTSSTTPIAFYGATVTTQPATIAAVTTTAITSVTTTAATTSSPAGYSTTTQADAIVTAINAIIVRQALMITQGNASAAALRTLGLVAAS